MNVLEEELIKKASKLFSIQENTYTWEEVERLIRADPILFARCLQKAGNPKYIRNDVTAKNKVLWIACNLAMTRYKANYCYLCGRSFTYEEYLDKKTIHLEHFTPRSEDGLHHPVNITLVCRDCNLIKSNFTSEDFRQILQKYFCPVSGVYRSMLKDMETQTLLEFVRTGKI